MNFTKLPAFSKGNLHAIIETPKGSRNKYAYDSKLKMMVYKKTLPEGSFFPFDFGFIPQTEDDDGDPLDVMVIMDAPAESGTLVICRVIGAITATQKEKGKKKIRNDRIIAIPSGTEIYTDVASLEDYISPGQAIKLIQMKIKK